MLGVVLKNVPVAKFVWNIGEIFFKILTWETFTWDSVEPLENFILGTLGEILGKILFWKSLKFGIFIWKKCFCPCLLNKTLENFTWEIFRHVDNV